MKSRPTHRSVTSEGKNLIKRFEGFSPHVYLDSAGLQTVGVGHLIKKDEDFSEGISEEQAQNLLARDLYQSERAVLRLISVPLTDNQFDALASFTFNLGGGSLQRSTLRQRINRGDYELADEFVKWCKAGGKVIKGLLRRRIAERRLFLDS